MARDVELVRGFLSLTKKDNDVVEEQSSAFSFVVALLVVDCLALICLALIEETQRKRKWDGQ